MTLAVASLAIRNFRSYDALEIEIGPRPVAIIGKNGAGKTNLLEAVSLFSPGRGLRRALTAELARGGSNRGWRVSAVLSSNNRLHELETRATDGTSRKVSIDGKTTPQVALGDIVRILWLVPSMDRLWIEGAEGRRRFLDRMALSLLPEHAVVAQSYERALRERNRLLRDNVRNEHWYAALEAQMAEAATAITANRLKTVQKMTVAQDEAQTAFPAADLFLVAQDGKDLNFGPATKLEWAECLARSRAEDFRAGRSLTGPHRSDLQVTYREKAMPASRCSTGEQKALLTSLLLSNARALASDLGTAPILLLDEVAAHLDADRRTALFDEICALKAQAWMTGTDAGLLEAMGDRAQWLKIIEDDQRGSRVELV